MPPRVRHITADEIKKRGRPTKDRPTGDREYKGPQIILNIVPLMSNEQVRRGRMLTAADLIRESGVSKHIIYRALNGELKEIPFDELAKLAQYFRVPPGDLLVYADEAVPTEI